MTSTKLCLLTLCATLMSTAPILAAAPAAAQTCAGDCNGDDAVAVDEIIQGIRIAFGEERIGECRAMDSDGDGAVTINDVVAAVGRALQGCGDVAPTTTDAAAVAAAVRVATEPIARFFEFQAGIGTPNGAERAHAAVKRPTAVSGCQQLNCEVSGTEEDCCSDSQFTQVFSDCITHDDQGGTVTLNGAFALHSDTADVCTGAIPVDASFTVFLSSLTRDVSFPDGRFSRTFQELSESFDAVSGGCTRSQPDQFGFAIRGDGRRSIDGELQQFQGDGVGNILVDTEIDVHALGIAVSSTQTSDGCTVAATPTGSLTTADFRSGTQFETEFTDLQVVQGSESDALRLELGGTVSTDCLGLVRLSTIEPVRIASGDTCFTGGRLDIGFDEPVAAAATYSATGELDLDFGADGSTDQHFATCTDVPATDKCISSAVGLCGACTEPNDCQTGLGCFPCTDNCSGSSKRCSLSDAFATCEDGVF